MSLLLSSFSQHIYIIINGYEETAYKILRDAGVVIKIIGLEYLVLKYIYGCSKSYNFRKSKHILSIIFIHYETI